MTDQPKIRWVEVLYPSGQVGIWAEHDGPCVFVDDQCTCGKLNVGTVEAPE